MDDAVKVLDAALSRVRETVDAACLEVGEVPSWQFDKSGLSEDVVLKQFGRQLCASQGASPQWLHLPPAALVAEVLAGSIPPSLPIAASVQQAVGQAWLNACGLYTAKAVYLLSGRSASLGRAIACALHRRFPTLDEDGLVSVASRVPTIYITADLESELLDIEAARRASYLPAASIRHVATQPGSSVMDMDALESVLERDVAEGRTPTLVIGRAGTSTNGDVDDLKRLRDLCDKYYAWMHVEGRSVALLVTPSRSASSLMSITTADSVDLDTARLLALPRAPHIMFARQAAPGGIMPTTGLDVTLPVWFYMQSVGLDKLVEPVAAAVERGSRLVAALTSSGLFEALPRPTDGHHIFVRATHDDAQTSRLLTQYVFKAYTNALMPKLHAVQARVGDLDYIHISPLDAMAGEVDDRVDAASETLIYHAKLARATLSCRDTFRAACENLPGLIVADLGSEIVGLGAVRYVPSFLSDASGEHSRHIEELNALTASKLEAEDPNLFGTARDKEGNLAIVIGVDSSPMTNDEAKQLASIVFGVAQAAESSPQFIETLAAIVRRGIEEAQAQLEQENQSRAYQQGIAGSLPIVGSLWNMVMGAPAPLPEAPGHHFKLGAARLVSSDTARMSRASTSSSTAATPVSIDRAMMVRAVETAALICRSVATEVHKGKGGKDAIIRAKLASAAVMSHLVSLHSDAPFHTAIPAVTLEGADLAAFHAQLCELINGGLGHFGESPITEEMMERALDRCLATDLPTDRGAWYAVSVDDDASYERSGLYCIGLAWFEGGHAAAAAMACPTMKPLTVGAVGRLFVAERGVGALERGISSDEAETRLRGSQRSAIAEAVLLGPSDAGQTTASALSRIGAVKARAAEQSLAAFALLAGGRVDVFVKAPVGPTAELALGTLFVTESGGKVMDVNGGSFSMANGPECVVAVSGAMAEAVHAALA